ARTVAWPAGAAFGRGGPGLGGAGVGADRLSGPAVDAGGPVPARRLHRRHGAAPRGTHVAPARPARAGGEPARRRHRGRRGSGRPQRARRLHGAGQLRHHAHHQPAPDAEPALPAGVLRARLAAGDLAVRVPRPEPAARDHPGVRGAGQSAAWATQLRHQRPVELQQHRRGARLGSAGHPDAGRDLPRRLGAAQRLRRGHAGPAGGGRQFGHRPAPERAGPHPGLDRRGADARHAGHTDLRRSGAGGGGPDLVRPRGAGAHARGGDRAPVRRGVARLAGADLARAPAQRGPVRHRLLARRIRGLPGPGDGPLAPAPPAHEHQGGL
ncbi:MAG: BUG/TctC family periplasmic protein, partial [uncultured Acetobacteraceae bacterium]